MIQNINKRSKKTSDGNKHQQTIKKTANDTKHQQTTKKNIR